MHAVKVQRDKEAEAVAARMYAAEDTVNARQAFLDGVRWGRAHPSAQGGLFEAHHVPDLQPALPAKVKAAALSPLPVHQTKGLNE